MIAALAIAFGVALVAVAVHHVVQRQFGYERLSMHNEVAGVVYSAVGVIFAVVLGFVVVVVWQKYDDVRADVDNEVAAVIDLFHTVDAFPPPLRARIQSQLIAYDRIVIRQEWPQMARGKPAEAASPVIEQIAHEVQRFQPVGATQQDAHQQALAEMRAVFDARRERIRANEPSVPPLLWLALYAGAVATLGFTYFFGVKNRIAQLTMTATLAALVAIMFVVMGALDHPFRGQSAIPPTGWYYFIAHAPAMTKGQV
jgi:hypothetical protein